MQILLVDFESSYTDRVENLLAGNSIKKVHWQDDLISAAKNVDAIILSGGHQFSVANHQDEYMASIDLIKQTVKPMLGICLGCQLLAFAYGAQLKRLPIRVKGLVTITANTSSPLIRNMQQFEAYENHRWSITEVSKPILSVATSRYGIEIIQHRTLPQFGVQFHPEMLNSVTPGQAIIANFLRLVLL